MLVVSCLLLGIGAFLWLPILSDAVSLLKATLRGPEAVDAHETPIQRLLFLVPAHDEADLIARCVRSLREQRYPTHLFRVVVVADNCSDETAAVARAAGASCLERSDPAAPGKPQAIAWALAHLDPGGFDALVIVDADSTVEPDFARELGTVRDLRSVGAQTYNGVANPEESPITRMAAVLAAAYYRFAYPLKQRAGLNVPLTGAGMCIGAAVLEQQGWTARSVAEDVEYYAVLTLARVRTVCLPEAGILSLEAPSPRAGAIQRRRWRRGRLEVARKHMGEILRCRHLGGHQKLDLAAELLTPGPATHLAVAMLAVAAAWILELPLPGEIVAIAAGSLARPTTYAVLGLSAVPNRWASAAAFLALPPYAAWRFGVEVASFIRRPTWTPSRR